MQEILSTFGIDWRLLLINALNFALVLLVLWYFLYTPLVRILESRRQKVAEGVRAAEAAKEKLGEIKRSKSVVLARAGKEADDVLAHARRAAAAKEKELLLQGEAAAARILKEAEGEAKELKERALAESRQEVAKLVVLGIEKVMAKQK